MEPPTGNTYTSYIVSASSIKSRPIEGIVSSGFKKAVPTNSHFLTLFFVLSIGSIVQAQFAISPFWS